MTNLANVLKLEIDTTANRSVLRNPSGRLGMFGWAMYGGGGGAISGSTSPVAEDGYAFTMTNLSIETALNSAPFPAPAGSNTVKVDFAAVFSVAKNVEVRVYFYDANGAIISTVMMPYAFTANTTRTITDIGVSAPTGATTASVTISALAGGGTGVIARVYISTTTTGTGSATPRPTVPNVWTDILSQTFSINSEQGNDLNGVEDVLQAGSLIAVIGNPTLDPATSTLLQKGRPIRLTATTGGATRDVWTGSIETADVDYDDSKGTAKPLRITLTATDDARKLLDATLAVARAGGFKAQVSSAARAAGLATYDGTMSPLETIGAGVVAEDASAKVADWLRRACNTHGGYVWVDGSNRTQQRLVSYLPTAPVAVMSDTHADTGALKYTSCPMNFGSRSLVNALTVKRFNTDEVEDNGAKEYGPYLVNSSVATYDRIAGSIEITDGSPSAVAAAVLPVFATPRPFPTEVAFATHDAIAAVLAVGLYDPVRVKRTAQGFDQVVRVLRIRHEIRAKVGGDTWKTTMTPRPLESGIAVSVTNPSKGADTGPSDIVAPAAGILGSRFRSTNLSIAANGQYTIPYDTAVTSDGITYDSSNRFVIPKDGRYQVAGTGRVDGTNVTTDIRIIKNGAIAARAINYVSGTGISGPRVDSVIKCVAGDVLSITIISSVAAILVGDVGRDTRFAVTYIGP